MNENERRAYVAMAATLTLAGIITFSEVVSPYFGKKRAEKAVAQYLVRHDKIPEAQVNPLLVEKKVYAMAGVSEDKKLTPLDYRTVYNLAVDDSLDERLR